MNTEDMDQFLGKVIKFGSGLGIVIPSQNVKFSGISEGEFVKIYYKKAKQKK